MPPHVQNGLVLVGLGLLFGFFGLLWVANLFGVADEHAKRIARSRVNSWMFGREQEATSGAAFKLGRYAAGGGFMLFGLVMLIIGIVSIVP